MGSPKLSLSRSIKFEALTKYETQAIKFVRIFAFHLYRFLKNGIGIYFYIKRLTIFEKCVGAGHRTDTYYFRLSQWLYLKVIVPKVLELARAKVTGDKSNNSKTSFLSVKKSSRGGNISSTEDKLSQLLEPNRPKFLGTKNLLKQTIRKTLETTPKQNIVRTPRKKHKDISNAEKDDSENFKKNLKIIQIQTKKLMDKR